MVKSAPLRSRNSSRDTSFVGIATLPISPHLLLVADRNPIVVPHPAKKRLAQRKADAAQSYDSHLFTGFIISLESPISSCVRFQARYRHAERIGPHSNAFLASAGRQERAGGFSVRLYSNRRMSGTNTLVPLTKPTIWSCVIRGALRSMDNQASHGGTSLNFCHTGLFTKRRRSVCGVVGADNPNIPLLRAQRNDLGQVGIPPECHLLPAISFARFEGRGCRTRRPCGRGEG